MAKILSVKQVIRHNESLRAKAWQRKWPNGRFTLCRQSFYHDCDRQERLVLVWSRGYKSRKGITVNNAGDLRQCGWIPLAYQRKNTKQRKSLKEILILAKQAGMPNESLTLFRRLVNGD